MDQRNEEHWRELSEEILTSMKEWRRSHPKATLREIEDEVHARMSRLEAQMIQDTAQESTSREWSGRSQQERPTCPVCQTPLHARGKRQRTLQGAGGRDVILSREYGTCPNCGTGLFPAFHEELALLPGSLTPKQQDHLAHLGSWMPYARAARMLESVLGVQVSEPTVRRGTERTGAWYEARQLAEVTAPLDPPRAMTVCEKQAISTDGAYVPLIGGEWAEVRTVVIGEVKPASKAAPDEVHTHHLSYFSRMTDAGSFGDLAEVEMRRRGVSQAQAVCAVTDGAGWIQGFIDLHRSDAVRILDFPHAAEHLGLLIEALQQAGVSLPTNPLERSLHVLKHRGPGLLLRWCERLPEVIRKHDAVHKQLQYFHKRVCLMDYPDYQRQGWPIGSGMVESANKLVVQARLKGAGMHWKPANVNPILALRTAVCSERWEEAWQEATQEQRTQLERKRHSLATTRFQSLLSSFMLLLLRFTPPVPKPVPSAPRLAQSQPAATLPGSSRPSAHHPWKRGPACRPKDIAKN